MAPLCPMCERERPGLECEVCADPGAAHEPFDTCPFCLRRGEVRGSRCLNCGGTGSGATE